MDLFYDKNSGDTIIKVLDSSKNTLCVANYKEPKPLVISKIVVENSLTNKVGYWRNMRKNAIQQNCVNTIGSFFCTDNTDEMIAIGFGGHTTSGSVYPNQITVFTNQRYTCVHHKIGDIQGRYNPGMAELDGWLYICGGNYYGGLPLIDCKKFDLNANNGAWINALNLPRRRKHFEMLTYQTSIYIVGGWDSGCINTLHEFNHQTNIWTSRANLPYPNHRHCSVADVEEDRIWMIGGDGCGTGAKMQVYYYSVSMDVWVFHSNLIGNQAMYDTSCGIIIKTTGEKWLLVVKGGRT